MLWLTGSENKIDTWMSAIQISVTANNIMNEFFYSCMTSSIVPTAPFASSIRRGWNHPSAATNLTGLPKDYRHHCKVVLLWTCGHTHPVFCGFILGLSCGQCQWRRQMRCCSTGSNRSQNGRIVISSDLSGSQIVGAFALGNDSRQPKKAITPKVSTHVLPTGARRNKHLAKPHSISL